jgi:hypothetical protein
MWVVAVLAEGSWKRVRVKYGWDEYWYSKDKTVKAEQGKPSGPNK